MDLCRVFTAVSLKEGWEAFWIVDILKIDLFFFWEFELGCKTWKKLNNLCFFFFADEIRKIGEFTKEYEWRNKYRTTFAMLSSCSGVSLKERSSVRCLMWMTVIEIWDRNCKLQVQTNKRCDLFEDWKASAYLTIFSLALSLAFRLSHLLLPPHPYFDILRCLPGTFWLSSYAPANLRSGVLACRQRSRHHACTLVRSLLVAHSPHDVSSSSPSSSCVLLFYFVWNRGRYAACEGDPCGAWAYLDYC